MTLQIDLSPETEARIRAQALAEGVPIESIISNAIENGLSVLSTDEDARIAEMRDAMNDELFMADLEETMEDFQHIDREHSPQ